MWFFRRILVKKRPEVFFEGNALAEHEWRIANREGFIDIQKSTTEAEPGIGCVPTNRRAMHNWRSD
jgi:hypothetical protein